MRNLVLAFDGTWNRPDLNLSDGDQSTNVWRFVQALKPTSIDGVEQRSWYFRGLGTGVLERLRGGIFGLGLSDKIVQGYRILADHYRSGDRVFLLGFSRGAYTARSLAGMIERVGLIHRTEATLIDRAYQLYRDGDADAQRQFKASHCRPMPIRAIAVWDTVGALGIPLELFDWLNAERYQFHDTQLGGQVGHAFQALALDEHRKNYAPTLWEPEGEGRHRIEQRWFVGSHADVGGGNGRTALANFSLCWIQQRLARLGLDSRLVFPDMDLAERLQPSDSWRDFLAGLYAFGRERFYRPVGFTQFGGESLSEVAKAQLHNTHYRPRNPLGPYLSDTRGLVLSKLSDYKDLSEPVELGILNEPPND